MAKCQHCSRRIRAKYRRVYCSGECELEHRYDSVFSQQRLNTFQALADTGTWLAIENISIYHLSNPARRLQVLESKCLDNQICYRLTKAGYRLLKQWKSKLSQQIA